MSIISISISISYILYICIIYSSIILNFALLAVKSKSYTGDFDSRGGGFVKKGLLEINKFQWRSKCL
jgi:hypothetical protein